MHPSTLLIVSLSATLAAQQLHVVPPAAATADANHRYFVGGTVEARRQLTLIDGALLQPLAGRVLGGMSFRRDRGNEEYAGGDAHLTVRLSHAARPWGGASPMFAQNHGAAMVVAFDGMVTLPTSPAIAGSQVSWDAQNTLHVPFTTPFVYQGGTLAVEVIGAPGQAATTWWPADAALEVVAGQVTPVGNGCGPFGGTAGEWSFLNAGTLVPGGTVTFSAQGQPGELAMWAISQPPDNPSLFTPFHLDIVGAPGCFVHLPFPMATVLTVFGPQVSPQQPGIGALATFAVQMPPMFAGASFRSQWLGLGAGGIVTSNAHEWTIAAGLGNVPMTVVTAPVFGSEPVEGKVIPGCGHVIRFEAW